MSSTATQAQNTQDSMLAIVGGTIIDGTGAPPLPEGVLLIEGSRIVAVGNASNPIPGHARRISAAGQYVIPGLMDANVHLFFPVTPDLLVRYEGMYEAVIAEAAEIALKNGVTTVFDTWGPREALTRVRDSINRGERPGSRIFFAGNIIGFNGPTSTDFFPIARSILSKARADEIDARWEQGVGANLLYMTAEQVRARVRAYLESGTQDFLKYASSGHTAMELIAFSEKVQRVIVEEGHRAGLTVQAHSTSPESLRLEIEAGADLLQHADVTGPVPIPEELLALMVERQIPCASLFVTRRFLAWNEASGTEPIKTIHRVKDENDRRLIAAGANVLLTTDGGVYPADAIEMPLYAPQVAAQDLPTALGESHFHWLTAAHELGMAPMDILKAATANLAKAYHVDRDLGTLEKGKIADLLILNRNPLENPSHYRSIRAVVKEGRMVEREALPTRPILTA
jgi:imidazolonepropionase-like amidohydrolase